MRVVFCGVGEAFDEHEGNTSVLLEHGDAGLLLDCGFTAASAFWRHAPRPLSLSVVCLSHFHGDHFFGLPALLVRFMEHGRTAPLTIIGQAGVEQKVAALMELAYPGTFRKALFELIYLESAPGRVLDAAGFSLGFEAGDHSQPCLAVRVQAGGRAVFYSGDGKPTEATQGLASGVDLVIHEAYKLRGEVSGHATVDRAIRFAERAGAARLALVHLQREVRRAADGQLDQALGAAPGMEVFVPEAGSTLAL